MHLFDHGRPDFEPYGFTCELWQAAPMNRPDRHNEIELNFLKNGSLTYLLGGERMTLPQGRLGVFWAAIPHQIIDFLGEPEYYVITLPLGWFLQCGLPAKLVDRLLHGQFLYDANPKRFEFDLQLIKTWEKDSVQIFDQPGSAIRLEVHARLLRFAESLPALECEKEKAPSPGLLGEAGISKVERMAAYIAKHYQEKCAIEDVARKFGLHPNYAMSQFKKTFHLTINEYLTQHRMTHAQRLLATTDHKVIDVAMEVGYSTLSRFYEAFKKSCGCSPNTYRRAHQINN